MSTLVLTGTARRAVPRGARPRRWLAWSLAALLAAFLAALVLAAFYLSTSEWCHCQRDTWMLLPALLALDLRRRQVVALGRPDSDPLSLAGRPFLEGLLWAAAFWIKPFVAVPALACWLAAARRVARTTPGRGTRLVRDGLLLLAGGLAAGAAGSAWLAASGGWADFWENMWVWNRHYVVHNTAGDDRWLPVA